jgi:hypothetical protein
MEKADEEVFEYKLDRLFEPTVALKRYEKK